MEVCSYEYPKGMKGVSNNASQGHKQKNKLNPKSAGENKDQSQNESEIKK